MTESVVKEQNCNITENLPVLFKLGLRALIKAKSDSLIILRGLELELLNSEHELGAEERNLFLNTDFKELGLTNEKLRNSYVNDQLSDLKFVIAMKKHEIASKKDTIELINDLIELNELELQGA